MSVRRSDLGDGRSVRNWVDRDLVRMAAFALVEVGFVKVLDCERISEPGSWIQYRILPTNLHILRLFVR